MKYLYGMAFIALVVFCIFAGFYVFEFREAVNNYLTKYDKLISFIFQFTTVVVALATAIIAVLIQNKSKNDKQIESSVECIEYWRGDDFLKLAIKYDEVVVKHKVNLVELSKIENRLTHDFKSIHDYLSEYEKVSIKVNTKVFDESVIYDQLGIIMYIQYFSCLKLFIEGVHKWNPGIYKNTEKLLAKWESKASKDARAFLNSQTFSNT